MDKKPILLVLVLFIVLFSFGCGRVVHREYELIDFSVELTEDSDFDELITQMSESEVVLLGESTHGTQEFYEYRSKISKRLIENHDFNVIVVEGDWNSIYQLNLYVKGLSNKTSAKEVLKNFQRWPTWMWANKEIKLLAEWLKEYNENLSLDEKVGFYGFDVYGVEKSITSVENMIGDQYECLSLFVDDFSLYASYIAERNTPCNKEAENVYEMIKTNEKFRENFSSKEYFYLKQNAFVVKNAELHYRAMVFPEMSSWNLRVFHMEKTLEKLIEEKGSKAIVWAHNTHVGDARATDMANTGMVNIGQLLREANKNVFILGFGTFSGEVLAGRSWGSTKEIMKIPEANENSYEALFENLGMEKTLIILNNVPQELIPINNNRAIGVVYNPVTEYPGNYVKTDLKARYDAFMFIRETNALESLS